DRWLTISIGIRKLLTTGTVTPFFAGSQFTGKFATYGTDCALLLTSPLPVVLVYIALQRWFVRVLTERLLKLYACVLTTMKRAAGARSRCEVVRAMKLIGSGRPLEYRAEGGRSPPPPARSPRRATAGF